MPANTEFSDYGFSDYGFYTKRPAAFWVFRSVTHPPLQIVSRSVQGRQGFSLQYFMCCRCDEN
jgi:hypothetical protein